MKKALSSTLLAATMLGGGVVGAGVLTGVAGAQSGTDSPVLVAPAEANDGVNLAIQDAEAEAEAQNDGEGCQRRGHRGRQGRALGTVAEVLDMEVDELRTELRDGATIADIAGDQTDDVIDALVDNAEARLDEGVADGRITQEEADDKLAEITERVTDHVNNGRPDRGDRSADEGTIAS